MGEQLVPCDDVTIQDPIEAHSKLVYRNGPCLSVSQYILPGKLCAVESHGAKQRALNRTTILII